MTLYDDVMRTIVELPQEQLKGLSSLCRRERISRAEAIRRAVGQMLEGQKAAETGIPGAFGIWKHRAKKARRLQRRLREEWS